MKKELKEQLIEVGYNGYDGYIVKADGRFLERVLVGKNSVSKWLCDGIIYRSLFDAINENMFYGSKPVNEIPYYCTPDFKNVYRFGKLVKE